MLQSLASSSCVRLMQNHKSTWYFASLLLGYVLYLVFGAIIFSSVELPYEDLLRQELRALKQRFLQENECLSEERLERFLKKALDASNYGVSILNNASINWNWDFTSSLFFASTVLSTTGEWPRAQRMVQPSGAQLPLPLQSFIQDYIHTDILANIVVKWELFGAITLGQIHRIHWFLHVQELLWSHICLNAWDRLVNIASISPKAHLEFSHTVQIVVFVFSSGRGGVSSRAAHIFFFSCGFDNALSDSSLTAWRPWVSRSPDTGVCLRGIRS